MLHKIPNPTNDATAVAQTTFQSFPAKLPINHAKITTTLSSFMYINNEAIALIILLTATPASSSVNTELPRPIDPIANTKATASNEPATAATAIPLNPITLA